MPHMQRAGTIFYVGVCVRTATINQMVSSTRPEAEPEAEVLGTRVIFFKYSYSYNLCVRYSYSYSMYAEVLKYFNVQLFFFNVQLFFWPGAGPCHSYT